MPIKVCYKKEIHRLSKTPKDFTALLRSLKEIFGVELPEKFTLQYEDSDGDKIVLANDEDYQLALDADLSKTLKISLTEVEDMSNSSFISKSILENLEQAIAKSNEEKISKKPLNPEPLMEQKATQATLEETDSKFHRKHHHRHHRKEKKLEFSNIPCECKGEVKPNGKPCKSCFGTGFLKKKEAKKREMLQTLVKNALYQELPKIVNAVKQSIEHPEESKKVIEEPKADKPIHYRVQCDVCGVCPIVGVRYKCTVTHDYDLCEKCEATVDHPYPLLKIKNSSQHPVEVITVLREDAYPAQSRPQQANMSMHSQEIQGLLNNLMSTVTANVSQASKPTQEQNTQTVPVQTEKKEEEAPVQTKDETPGEKKEEEETPQGNEFDAMLIKEISTIPEKIEAKDLTIYKTISVRNTGLRAWPKNSYIESEGEISGESCKLPSIEAGKEFSTVLIMKSPGKQGNFQSKWRFGYIDEKGNNKNFGKEFTVEFKIGGAEANLFAEVEQEKQEKQERFAPEVMEKALAVQEIFPQANLDEICEYIEQEAEKTIEELVQDYMNLLE